MVKNLDSAPTLQVVSYTERQRLLTNTIKYIAFVLLVLTDVTRLDRVMDKHVASKVEVCINHP